MATLNSKVLLGAIFTAACIVAFLGFTIKTHALSTYLTVQGGTGTSSPSGILSGDNGVTSHLNTVVIGTGLSYSGNTLSNTGALFAFPFDPETWWGQAAQSTTTALHLKGSPFSLFASSTAAFSFASSTNASTTLSTINSLWLPSLGTGAGALAIDTGNKVYSTGTSTPTVTAPITYSGTLGQFLSGVSGAFGCTNASAGVTGCLTGTDWSTFNAKQASGFQISTGTPISISNVAYFTGVTPTSLGGAATSTLGGGTTGLTFSNNPAILGASASALSGTLAIANGGTNQTAFTTNSIVYFDGTRLVSTSTEPLYVGSIIATSTIKASGFGSTTPWAYLSINPTAGVPSATAPRFAIGSSTATSFLIDNKGNGSFGSTTAYAGLGVNAIAGQAAFAVGSTTSELFSVNAVGTTTALRFDVSGTATSTINAGLFIKTQGLTLGGLTSCSGTTALTTNSIGGVVCGTITATASAGGSPTQIQYNSSGALGGISGTAVSASGNTGFGSSTPWATLAVSTTTALAANLPLFGVSSSTNSSIFYVFGNGNVGIGTTTPWATLAVNPLASAAANQFVVGSSTATNFLINNAGQVGIGTSSIGVGLMGQSNIEAGARSTAEYLTGSNNGFLELNIQNRNNGSSASSDIIATSDNGSATTHYINYGINSSGGGAAPFTTANHGYLYTVDDPLNIGALGATTPFITFNVGGGSSPIERARLTLAGYGIGTSTPQFTLQVASSTRPAFAFESGRSGGDPLLTFRYASTSFYISTSSNLAPYATSSNSTLNNPFTMISGGISGLFGFGSSTPWANVGITNTAGIPGFSVGSTTGTSFMVDFLGRSLFGTTTAPTAGYSVVASSTLVSYENRVATSSTTDIPFGQSNMTTVRMGSAAMTLTFSQLWPGAAQTIKICNPNQSVGGALTWPTGGTLLWDGGTVPTQITTADKCWYVSCRVSVGTSTVAKADCLKAGGTSGF